MDNFHKTEHSKKSIFINNFIGGLAWALGATLGLGIIFVLLGIILKNINLVPFIGEYISEIINFVLEKNPNLIKN